MLFRFGENIFDVFLTDDKAFMAKKRQEALTYVQQKNEEKAKEKMEIKEKNKKYSLKEMMKVRF